MPRPYIMYSLGLFRTNMALVFWGEISSKIHKKSWVIIEFRENHLIL